MGDTCQQQQQLQQVPLTPAHMLVHCRLALNLFSYLGLGYKWLLQVYRLVLYAMFLLPGFLQVSSGHRYLIGT